MKQPKLRDSHNLIADLYPLGQPTRTLLTKIGAGIVYLIHTGRNDISGNDWGDILANSVGGKHLSSPVGIADVVMDKMAWSAKTVKCNNPFSSTSVRLISGRCSPDYSFGIEDPHDDIQKTGEAVLAIWNSRVDIALAHYPKVRMSVLVRSYDLSEFVFFEDYLKHFRLNEYEWQENPNGNIEGYSKYSNNKCFTWQPHGSQFTIHTSVPDDAIKFRIRRPPLLTQDIALKNIGFDDSWIEIIA